MISRGQRRPQISDALPQKTVSRPSKPSGLRKNSKICHSEPRSVLNRVRNLLFPWLSCEQQIPHPQTTRVRDDKSDCFRSLLAQQTPACLACAYRSTSVGDSHIRWVLFRHATVL